MTILLLTLVLTTVDPGHTIVGNQDERNYTITKNPSNMKTNRTLKILATLSLLLTIGLQAARSQDKPFSTMGQGHIDEMNEFRKMVESGKITSKFLEENPYSDENAYLKEIMDDDSRKTKIQQSHYHDYEPALLEAKYQELIKFLKSKGLRYMAPMNPALSFVYDEIIDTKKIIDEFDPKTQIFTAKNKWVFCALSKKHRENWAAEFFKGLDDQKPRFYTALDNVAASFAKKASVIVPSEDLFANHNAADEALMKKQIPATVKVHKIGIEYSDWEIQWNKSVIPNIQEKRFKRAYIWGKDSADDFGFCRLYQVNLIQDHIGGGKYGATKALFLDSWPKGCPK